MPQSPSLVTILASNDLDASEAFYARLGFRRVDAGPDEEPGGEYRILRDRHGAILHLNRAVEGWLIPGRNPLALYYSRPDVDELTARLADEVIEPEGPSHKPWGMYEFAVGDPDSTLLRIGWPSRLRGGGLGAAVPPANRSMPQAAVVPVLGYADVGQSAAWLCHAFDFTVRLRIADHRIQLNVGDGGAVVLARTEPTSPPAPGDSVMVRVSDVDAHCARAVAHGARVQQPPQDHPYGERQYVAADPDGRVWTFSQSIADVPPEAWGGEAVTL